MALTGNETLYVLGQNPSSVPAATEFQTTTGAIAALAASTGVGETVNTAISTAGAGTLTAAGIVGGIITRTGPVADYSDATATAAQIVAAIGAPFVGQSFNIQVINTVGYTQTITAGAGVTLSGSMVVAGNSTAAFLVTLTSLTAVTILRVATAVYSNAAAQYISTGLIADGATVFNEAGAAVDFRVESDGSANALKVDGTNNRVGILTASPTVPLDVTGAILGSTTITAGTALAAGTTVTAGTGLVSTTTTTAGTYFLRSVGNALTAAGTDRATGLQLAKEVNNITTAAASTGVVLPVGVVGMRITIFNGGANAIQVYASASETIDGVAGATGVPLANTKRADFFFTAANTWISAQLGVVSA